jgi:hypothetical protein
MHTARKIAIVLVALVVMTFGLALPAQAGTEGDFLSRINASRAAAGLAPVSMHSDLVPDARSHSAEMMAAGQIFHSSNLGSVASGWEALAENVGAGPSVASLHTAFMNSAGHRANILGNYNHVGVGVVTEGDLIWVTVIFMRKGSVPEPTTTTTTTTAAPVTTTTTTTAAPVTTTTTTTAAPFTTTTNPQPPGPGSESMTTTTAPTTTSSAAPASDQPAGTANATGLETEPSSEIQNSTPALHLPIAD